MPELPRADPPTRSASPRTTARSVVRAHTHLPDEAGPEPHARPSRLVPFLAFGAISLTLFAVAGILRREPVPLLAALGDYACLGACLSGVAAAIFGCVTSTRAARRRRR